MKYARGVDNKILWCWKCKKKILKKTKVYLIKHTGGKFECEDCYKDKLARKI